MDDSDFQAIWKEASDLEDAIDDCSLKLVINYIVYTWTLLM